jgi:hypothetical protein
VSVLAACLHKAEWVCRECAKCSSCCVCAVDPPQLVHINTKDAAVALARHARRMRDKQP